MTSPKWLDMRHSSCEMASLIAGFDWGSTPLGPISAWCPALMNALDVALLSHFPMYIAWGEAGTLLYNDAYAALLAEKHPRALGLPASHFWPEAWQSLSRELRQARTLAREILRDASRQVGAENQAEIRSLSGSMAPIFDETGRVGGILCSCIEAMDDIRARRSLEAESARLRDLFQQAPGFMAVLQGPEHVFEVYNQPYLELIGNRDVLGKPVREALPEIEGQGLFELLDQVYRTGQPFSAKGAQVLLRRNAIKAPEPRIIDFVYQPIRDHSGSVTGIFVQGYDVTEAARSERLKLEAERLAKATVDALPQHIAVIDDTGLILMTNRTWREFADENEGRLDRIAEGANYVAECERAAAAGNHAAATMLDMINKALEGRGGQSDLLFYDCHSPDEERWFEASVNATADGLSPRIVIAHREVTSRVKYQRRVEYLATHDGLTGLPNRNLLQDRAEQAIAAARGNSLGLALLFLDLDNFKNTNDVYGHSAGDQVLQTVAAELRTLVGSADTVARLGGDEFILLLTNLRDAGVTGSKVAEEIINHFGAPIIVDGREVAVNVSIGISLYPSDGGTFEELLKSADTAMYSAKAGGRRLSRFYSPILGERVAERVRLEAQLRQASRENQFQIMMQPQFHLSTGRLTGAEALLRWRLPVIGSVAPSRFIPVAEETGLIIPIGAWLLRVACREASSWAKTSSPVSIAINISAVQLRHPDFVDAVEDILDETGLSPDHLEFEITESMLMADEDHGVARLDALKSLGITLAIDDFGTGFSNLSYLQRFPLDRLKIDRSFIAGLPHDKNAAAIVRAIIALGQSLGMELVAEGVETAEQLDFLRAAGCSHVQGFLFSRPLEPAAMSRLISDLAGQSCLKAEGPTFQS